MQLNFYKREWNQKKKIWNYIPIFHVNAEHIPMKPAVIHYKENVYTILYHDYIFMNDGNDDVLVARIYVKGI